MIPPDDLSELSMEQLFQMEAETQCSLLSDGLVALESNPSSQDLLADLMRAAHSLKGAARIVGQDAAVKVAHAMEDCFVLAQQETLNFAPPTIDLMLKGVDLLRKISLAEGEATDAVPAFVRQCAVVAGGAFEPVRPTPTLETPDEAPASSAGETSTQMLRVDSEKLDRLLGFAGEGLVAARQINGFLSDLRRIGLLARATASRLPSIHASMAEHDERLLECRDQLAVLQETLRERHAALDLFSRRWNLQADRLYQEALACRMRPLSDILPGLRRLVRDLSRELGKPAILEVVGEDTPVDREILERLESPLSQLLRNALDHGVEPPAIRAAAGKPERARILIEARHIGGQLAITIGDDGGGVDLNAVRSRITTRGLASDETVSAMNESEIVDFLFLPGFSMRDTVTEISGRGAGLDIVQSMARSVRGSVRAVLRPGRGLNFELRLPISLSVLRSLLVRIANEAYAFPLAHIERAIKIPISSIESTEGRQFFIWEGLRVSLATAGQILDLGNSIPPGDVLSVLLQASQGNIYGVIVDAFLGEHDLVVQPLDPALGKIPGIASASLTASGEPVLVVDADDFAVTMERLAADGAMRAVQPETQATETRCQRILVVEDSLTVRELERKLLRERGYEVEVAVDGMDGWTALRGSEFDLVLTDVDMPRMDGIELTRLIKADARLRDTPVMIVSYKDREEDRRRGLDAGADYYLTKGSFQDQTLIAAVLDLIGEPQ